MGEEDRYRKEEIMLFTNDVVIYIYRDSDRNKDSDIYRDRARDNYRDRILLHEILPIYYITCYFRFKDLELRRFIVL